MEDNFDNGLIKEYIKLIKKHQIFVLNKILKPLIGTQYWKELLLKNLKNFVLKSLVLKDWVE